MDIFAETDNTTKNIVQEILRESLRSKVVINEDYCNYFVKLLMLNPAWGISAEKKINRTIIQKLVAWILNKFQEQDCLSLATTTIQQYYMGKYMTKEKVVKNHYDLINSTIKPLLKIIVDATEDDLLFNKSKLLKQIGLYIILVSKMGNVKDPQLFKESFQALKSIFDEDNISEFVKLNEKERKDALFYNQKVVMGIRLFNSDCGRYTATIADLPKIILKSTSIMQVDLQKDLCQIMDIVNLTTTAIESVFVNSAIDDIRLFEYEAENKNNSTKLPEGITQEDLERTLNILAFARQHEVYLRKFLLDIKEIQNTVSILLSYFREILGKIHQTVKYKIAVMASTVFPLFLDLGEVWISIQEETIAFSHLIQVFQYLGNVAKKIEFDRDKMYIMIGDNRVMTDAMRLEKTTGIRIGHLLSSDCEILDPLNIVDFENLHLEFLGFCIWKFILTNGALIPGNPNMGVLKWDQKYYVFSVPEAAVYFANDPKKMVLRALMIARTRPELITLLQIEEQIYNIRNIELEHTKQLSMEMKTNDKQVQTEIHPIPPTIVKNYEWNSWNILKYSVFLADLSTRRTRANQTTFSKGKCQTHVQTINPKDKSEQTKKDNYTSTNMITHYRFGFRGRTDNLQFNVGFLEAEDKKTIKNCPAGNDPILLKKRNYPVLKTVREKSKNK